MIIEIIATNFWLHDIWHPLNGNGYQFWSGIGSDVAEITLFGAMIGAWRKVNCHAPWCLRFGHHQTKDGFKVCRKHHPDLPNKVSLEDIHRLHKDHDS